MRSVEDIFRQVETVADFSGHTISSINYKNGYGDTPLHIVSVWGDHEAIEILVSAGADVNAKGESGYTPLHCAAEQNKPEAIVALLRCNAKIVTDSSGQTPLELASDLGNTEAVNAFLKDI